MSTKNRFNVISALRSVPEKENLHLQETYIFAWGQVGRQAFLCLFLIRILTLDRILNDEELNLILLRLVEYLGNSNSVISGAAFNEVRVRPTKPSQQLISK